MVNSFLIKEGKQVNEGKANLYNKQYENNGYLYVPQILKSYLILNININLTWIIRGLDISAKPAEILGKKVDHSELRLSQRG